MDLRRSQREDGRERVRRKKEATSEEKGRGPAAGRQRSGRVRGGAWHGSETAEVGDGPAAGLAEAEGEECGGREQRRRLGTDRRRPRAGKRGRSWGEDMAGGGGGVPRGMGTVAA